MRKSIRIRPTSGPWAASAILALALGGGLASCSYGFEGGGFPAHIRTIYIEPFENQTAQFDLEQVLYRDLLAELPAKLGLQAAGRETADAILTGQIRRYQDQAQAYRAGANQPAGNVLTNEVQIGISARLVDVRDNVIRWESSSLVGRGTYRPDSQDDEIGQEEAIAAIIEQIIDGAQSQW